MSDDITFPFDPERPTLEQIEAVVDSLPPRPCPCHRTELLTVDKATTIARTLGDTFSNKVEFNAHYDRCSACPHNTTDSNEKIEDCAVGPVQFAKHDLCKRDDQGKPLPRLLESEPLDAKLSPREQFNAWLAANAGFRCSRGDQVLHQRDARMELPKNPPIIHLQLAPCLTCRLERMGILPEDARASFAGFVVDPSALKQHFDCCRAFAAAPTGVLLLIGNCGAGKTHLATAILRERLRLNASGLIFVKHRQFIAEHRLAMRPVPFGEEPPEGPLRRCQEARLLVYDDLAARTDNRDYEEVLLDLFEHRIGHQRPSIITTNLNREELEIALGTRLFDRLRGAAFAVLEFGFESKRKEFNREYLNRAAV